MSKLIRKAKKCFKTTDFNAIIKRESKNPIFWIRFSAYAIPLAFLLYVLYINFLPFGYHKTFTIDVGSENDTTAGEFYLEPSRDLSERKITPDGTTYRELNGSAYAVFKPKAVLKDAEITVSVEGEGEGISIIPPVIDLNPDDYKWNYSWDFTKEETLKEFKGNAFLFDGATYFNGKDTRLELLDSKDKFEDGPFSLYVEWNPQDNGNNTQQIIGHFNWEIWQNKDSVEFRVGRMTDKKGPSYSIKYLIIPEFFNIKHSLLAIYNPSDKGYIELYIDNTFAGRTYFNNEKIWKDYGDQNLSFGWTPHNNKQSPYFTGYIQKVNIISQNVSQSQTSASFKTSDNNIININLISNSILSNIDKIKLNVSQR